MQPARDLSTRPHDSASALEQVWPAVQRRLQAMLRKRGASRELAEDIAQEVALRCMSHGVAFVDAEDLTRWCNTAAANLLVDHHRVARRIVDVELPEPVSDDDVFRIVDGRLALRATFDAIGQLAPIDRRALIDVIDEVAPPPRDRRESTMLAVRRNRARVRLRALMAAATGWLVVALRAGRRAVRVPAVSAVAAVAAVLPLLIAAPLVPRSPWEDAAPTDTSARAGAAVHAAHWTRLEPRSSVRAEAAAVPAVGRPTPVAGRLPDATVATDDGRVRVTARAKDEPDGGAPLLCVRPDLPVLTEACTPEPVVPPSP